MECRMKLAQLQRAYRGYLLTGDSAALAPAIVTDAFDAAERLGIYRNNFLISLTDALKANFPVTQQLVGGDFYTQTARRFVLSQPPNQPCLFEYGAAFADYLSALPELAALPYVADIARFEYARIAAYNAATEQYISAGTLAGIAPEQLDALPIRLARHTRIVAVQAPVLALWEAHQKHQPDLAGIDMKARPHALLVCRPDRTLMVRELEPAAAQLLLAAAAGTTLGQAAAHSGTEDGAALSRIIALALELRLLATP
jgi:hypothetical protein